MMWISMFFFFCLLNMKENTTMSIYMEPNSINNFMLLISCTFMFLNILMNSNMDLMDFKNPMKTLILILILSNTSFYSTEIMIFIICLEMSIYPMMTLFMRCSKDKDKMSSFMFMFNINIMGSLIFMYSLVNMFLFSNMMISIYNVYTMKNFLISMFFLFMLLTKVPMMFTQFWLSKAHVSAAGNCSMILASVMLKLGSYGFIKFWSFMKMSCKFMQESTMSFNIWSMMFFCMLMIRFYDLKLIVAYSSILHMALTIPLTMKFMSTSMIATVFMLVGHGLISCIFFFLVSMIYEISKNRNMDINKSLHSWSKLYFFLIFVVILMNMGLPPFINFYSEFIFLVTMYEMSTIYTTILSISMLLMIMFNMMIIIPINHGKKNLLVKKNLNVKTMKACSAMMLFTILLPFMM